MSVNVKLGFLALIGAAAAVPQHAHHHKFHHRAAQYSAGYVGPSSGWVSSNSTKPTGSSAAYTPKDEATTYIDTTTTSTETIYKTVYVSPVPKSSSTGYPAVAQDFTSEGGYCGPATVYVTATAQVTVTVASSSAAYTPSSYAVNSTSVVVPVPSSSFSSSASSSSALIYSPVPVPSSSSVYTPVPASSTYVYVTPSPAPSSVVVPVYSSAVTPSPVSSVAASSVYTPSPTPSAPSGGYSGAKRGLAYRYDGASQCASFDGKGFGFASNWESKPMGDIGNIPFIPTLRSVDRNGEWAANVDSAVASGSKVVFGYNEPDISSQAALSVSDLCSNWVANMNPIAAKYPQVEIVGPSVSSSENPGQGLDYLNQFKTQCPQAIWSSANVHWYGPTSAGFTAFQAFIDKAVAQYGSVWVGEWSLTGATAEETSSFLSQCLTYLDANPGVKGYSFYAVGDFDPTLTMLGTGANLTPAGNVYVNQAA